MRSTRKIAVILAIVGGAIVAHKNTDESTSSKRILTQQEMRPLRLQASAPERHQLPSRRKPFSRKTLGVYTGTREPELSDPVIREDGDVTYWSYRQLWNGLLIAPYGNLSLTVDARGKVIERASDYLRDLEVAQVSVKSETQARTVAVQVASRLGTSRVLGGHRMVWVSSPGGNGEPARGRQAYEYNAQGVQIIVDAATLEILKTTSQRHL